MSPKQNQNVPTLRSISVRPLTKDLFLPFGQVIDTSQSTSYPINDGKCLRFHDLASIDVVGSGGRPSISIFRGEPCSLPLSLFMMERHPLGSQAFIPLQDAPFLVIVARSDGDKELPLEPVAFLTGSRQGVSIGRNIWHGVLAPLEGTSDFVVVDRVGDGSNLEVHHFDEPYIIERD